MIVLISGVQSFYAVPLADIIHKILLRFLLHYYI